MPCHSPQVNSPLPTEAVRQSAIALNLATRASFNHEMLAMLYFPDEHKWAVYTPLFGPLGESARSPSPPITSYSYGGCH